MNMMLSGSGVIPGGEYEDIKTSGSSKLQGLVKCTELTSSGSCKGESVECSGMLKASGTVVFSGDVSADNISTSGAFTCGGELKAVRKITCSGSIKCKGSIRCNSLAFSGSLRAEGDIEGESLAFNGTVKCKGLINAEKAAIEFSSRTEIGNIGGSQICISKNKCHSLINKIIPNARIEGSIEGDEIDLEHTDCPRVTGRKIIIGNGCNIGLVQYSESVEISPKARVKKSEKI